ncbi:MAG: ABC transporter ATP-binding protein [Candidatus Aquilonibacter sp.]
MLLKLHGINKTYQTDEVETRALRDIDLAIERGEYVSIEGPSGCGKSTLLSIIGLLDAPTSGEYVLNERMVGSLSASERASIRNREIGFIFQNFNLIGDLTVEENVDLPLTYRGVSKAERRRRVGEVLERVNVAHRARHYPAQLSGGQQQRVAVARALAGNPSVLLADEPTGNLDSAHGEAVMELLAELHAGGSTIVMVTHDRRFATYAKRTIGLLDGCLADSPRLAEAHL